MQAPAALRIRPPEPADAETLLAFELANREWFETWVQPRDDAFYSLEGVHAAIAQSAQARRDDRGYHFLVLDGERLVGRVNLHGVRRSQHQCAELGYRVARAEAGRGVATAAAALCLAQAFGPLALWRVEATAWPGNAGSIRVLERRGFRRFGHSRRSVRLHGQWRDLLHFERHADDASPCPGADVRRGTSRSRH